MTTEQKERFCLLAAALLAPPDEILMADLEQPGLRAEIEECAAEWGTERDILSPFFSPEGTRPALGALEGEYERLFLDPEGERVSLVESTYKPWMTDGAKSRAIDGSKGLLMADSALHIGEMYRQAGIEIPEELRTTPDHLVAELEFLALHFRCWPEEWAGRFAGDHLDWLEGLEQEMGRAQAHPFYRNTLDIIRLFLANELPGEKVRCYG
jgi:TorA maturation chaperone TorD